MRKNHLNEKFSIYTTDENKKKILAMANREDRSMAYTINKIFTEYFEMIDNGFVSASNPFEDISYPNKRKEQEAIKELQEQAVDKQVFSVSNLDGIEEF